MVARFFRWVRVLEIRFTFWRFGVAPEEETRRKWRNYIATGDPTREKDARS